MKMNYYKFVSLLLLSSSLSGCGGQCDLEPYEPWKLEAKRHTHFESFSFNAGQNDLSAKQQSTLKHMIMNAKCAGPVYVRVLVNAPATAQKESDTLARVTNIKNNLRKLGIASHRLDVHYLTHSEAASLNPGKHGSISVVFDQYEIIDPNCPGWDEPMEFWMLPEGEKNFGCTTVKNMAHMIAEPRDVYRAHRLEAGDGARDALFVDRYRRDKIKQLKIESSSVGASSQSSSTASSGDGGSTGGASGGGMTSGRSY